MSEEEAIRILRGDVLGTNEQTHEAVFMAIKALKAEPKHGKWIYPTDIVGFGRCENCKALWDVSLIRNKFFKHCPRCGHPMERGAEILKIANEQVEYLSYGEVSDERTD